jgi:hypothetical protein
LAQIYLTASDHAAKFVCTATSGQAAQWTLKQVQGDDD